MEVCSGERRDAKQLKQHRIDVCVCVNEEETGATMMLQGAKVVKVE